MQNNQTYSEIFSFISTKEDLLAIQEELNLLQKSLYESGNQNFDFVLKNSISSNLSNFILKVINGGDKEKILKSLQEELTKIKILELTLSENLNQDIKEKISNWFKSTVTQKIALDIKIDPSILGGAVITFDGKYFDASLRLILSNTLKKYV